MGDGKAVDKYVTLVSGDGFEFVVLRDATMISPAIKSMLGPGSKISFCISLSCLRTYHVFAGQFAEAATGRCIFQEIK